MFCYQLSRKENDTTTAESLIDPYYLPQEIKQTHFVQGGTPFAQPYPPNHID